MNAGRKLAVFGSALQLFADLLGWLVLLILPVNPEFKRVALTAVFAITIPWDLAILFGFARTTPAAQGQTGPSASEILTGMFVATLALLVTVTAIILLWTNLGLSALAILWIFIVILSFTTVIDVIAAYYALK